MAPNNAQRRTISSAKMLEAALEEFAEKGYSAARIETMAKKAGVSKGLYSQRFSSKENLFLEVLASLAASDSSFEKTEGDLEEESLRFVDMIKDTALNRPLQFKLMCSMLNESDIPESAKELYRGQARKTRLYAAIEKEIEAGRISGADADRELLAFAGSACAITRSFSQNGLALPESENYLRLADGKRTADRNEALDRVIKSLTEDYEGIIYVQVGENALEDVSQLIRIDPKFSAAIPDWEDVGYTFHNRLQAINDHIVHPEDRTRFELETRRPAILDSMRNGSAYYLEFRTLIEGEEGRYQIKFVPFYNEEGLVEGFTAGLHNIDEEINRGREEQKRLETINVLASEYNAVYYCDALTHDYDICYQQGFVRAELIKTLRALPKFEDAFTGYITMLVHPEDQEMMLREITLFSGRLAKRHQYKVEFRRRYGDVYKYTTMKVVRVGDEEEMRYFVVGFAESDAEHHRRSGQRKQLEYIVQERTKELRERNMMLNRINEEVVEMIGNITEARDAESGTHIRRVKGYTRVLANQVMQDWPEYGLNEETIALMTSASALHDVGKIAISDTVLLKPDRLTPEEFEIMKTHCEKGCRMLEKAPADLSESYLKMSMDICLYHHEKYDGKGYPLGLKGDDIPVAAQIVSVADCFDALTSKRVYKAAYSPQKSFEMILNGECGAFSEKMLKSFLAVKDKFVRVATENPEDYVGAVFSGAVSDKLSWTRFLLVDEDGTNLIIGNEILSGEGAEVTEAKSGAEAVEIFRSSPEGSFDAILLDTALDDMSAEEATAAIRGMERSDAQQVVIVGLSSFATENEINDWLAAGMDSCLPKPVSISSLEKVLYECMSNRPAALGKAVENSDETAEQTLTEAVKRSPVFSVDSENYELLCYVNGRENTVPACKYSDELRPVVESISRRLPTNRRLDRLFSALVPAREFGAFIQRVKRGILEKYLSDHQVFHTFVPVLLNGKETVLRLIIASDNANEGCYIMGLKSIEAESRLERHTREMIRNLSELYLIVDYIDFENDTFTRYQRLNENNTVSGSGSYSLTLADYIKNGVHKDDTATVVAFTNPENVRSQLRLHKRMTLRYRSVYTGRVLFCEMQFIKVGEGEDVKNAIFTIENIDETVQRERRNDEMLIRARQILSGNGPSVGNDLLTGVKSISAYTAAVAKLSYSIELDEQAPKFGAVVCDVDNLKEINEAQGQNAGDMYIRNCCKLLCDVFKRSPVYRTGGGSFTAILTGDDYENRVSLLAELEEREKNAKLAEKAPYIKAGMSFGMAEYRPDEDTGVAEVLTRAEMEMLKNKSSRLYE